MSKIRFVNNRVEDYTIILSNRGFQHYGQLTGIESESVDNAANLNSANEMSFKVYKYKLIPDQNIPYKDIESFQNYIWDNLIDRKLIYVKELNEYYQIKVSIDDSQNTVKSVNATSLCEAELSQINIYNTEINTENDIAREDYEATTFYNPDNPNASLLDRIIKDKAPHYTIKHVDKSLCGLQRIFSIDGTSINDFFRGECSEQFDCLFQFDTVERGIYVYDLLTVCNKCGERGDFTDKCPKCSGTDLKRFGKDTPIYVDKTNLTDAIHLEVDSDSIKNCFKLECGDEIMTATVRSLNPNGSDYLYLLSEEDKNDMPKELVQKLDEYDKLYQSYIDEYQNLTTQIYELTDDILYYRSSMMPTIENAEITAETEAAKLTEENLSPLAISELKDSTSLATINSALKNYAKVFVKTGYVKLEIEDGAIFTISEETGLGQWKGRFKVTNYSNEEDVAYSNLLTIEVNDNFAEWMIQNVEKNIASYDDDNSVFDVLSIDDLEKFKESLTLYSLNRLISFRDAIQGALDVLIKSNQGATDAELYQPLYIPYYEKLVACESEIDARQTTIDGLMEELDNLNARQSEIQSDLDIKKSLGDLYSIFCSYRREDKFSNSNYISDGLDNTQIIQRAKEFWKLANNEIKKASNGECTITASLYDLLVIPEFKPLLKHFELGNRIRVRVDGVLYTLMLIGYRINFGNLQTIDVTFSTATKVSNEQTKQDDIIESAKSMATNYSSVQKQAEKGKQANDNVNSVLQNGLNSGLVQIKNNENEEVTYGKHGLLCRSYDDVLGDFVDKQLKLTHNTIAFTDDNWKSVKTVIGENSYISYNPTENKWEQLVGYGLTSQYVMSGVIYGENEIIGGMIRSKNYSDGKTLDKDGNLLAKGGSYIDLNTGEFSFGGDSIYYRDNEFVINETVIGTALETIDIKAENLHIDAGNVDGELIAKTIVGGQIYSLDYQDDKNNPTTHIDLDNGTFNFGDKFVYDDNGLNLFDGNIKGGYLLIGDEDKEGTYAEITEDGVLNCNGGNFIGAITGSSFTSIGSVIKYAKDYTEEDLTIAQEIAIGKREYISDYLEKYDFDCDGIIKGIDLLQIQKMLTGEIDSVTIDTTLSINKFNSTNILQTTGVSIRPNSVFSKNINCEKMYFNNLYVLDTITEHEGYVGGITGEYVIGDKTVRIIGGIITHVYSV